MADRRWSGVLLILGIAVCLGFSFGAYKLAGHSWDQVAEYYSPYTEEALPPTLEPRSGLADRVVLVIVDGMRDDVTRSSMPNIDKLRTYGTDAVLAAPQPSLSFPDWTTILTGASQTISGVTTNWFEGRVPVPTIMDMASSSGRRVAVIGPEDFAELYGVTPGLNVSLRAWPKGGYLSGTLVDDALRITAATDPELLVLHLPDLDEAGHESGGDSAHYRDVAKKIDADLSRLISSLQDEKTAFVIVADHGHIATGGHGGWEQEVVSVPLIVSGMGARLAEGVTGSQTQVAPTVAALLGVRPPQFSEGTVLEAAVATVAPGPYSVQLEQQKQFADRYMEVVAGQPLTVAQRASQKSIDAAMAEATQLRQNSERVARLRQAGMMALAALLTIAFVAVASWRAFKASLIGVLAYFAVYNALFFLVHGYQWSLSAFNTEDHLQAFFNGRMLEAAIAGLVAVGVAAATYPFFRESPKGPQVRGYLGGWLALAPATVLVVQMFLALQVAWFLWWYGAEVVWILPDFKWGFKYDLDLVQVTALGAAALLGPLVSYIVGRYHPRVRGVGRHSASTSHPTE